jgi:hypothetical protein
MTMQKGGKRKEEEIGERCRIYLTAVHYYQHKHYHAPVITFEAHFPLQPFPVTLWSFINSHLELFT